MAGKTKGPRVYNVIPRPDAWAWKTKRALECPISDNYHIICLSRGCSLSKDERSILSTSSPYKGYIQSTRSASLHNYLNEFLQEVRFSWRNQASRAGAYIRQFHHRGEICCSRMGAGINYRPSSPRVEKRKYLAHVGTVFTTSHSTTSSSPHHCVQ